MLDKLIIYTDGACEPNPGEGGWACVVMNSIHEVRQSGYEEYSTNQRMEITSVLEALRMLSKPYEIDLYTDSMYVINTASSWLDGWIARGDTTKANLDLWYEYKDLSEGHIIHFHHIKGHNGDTFNEICDSLAVGAIKDKKGSYIEIK